LALSLEVIELSALRTAGAGWVIDDSLVLTVDVAVEREDRFQLDTGALRGALPSAAPFSRVCATHAIPTCP
jgi:hypothetical protein